MLCRGKLRAPCALMALLTILGGSAALLAACGGDGGSAAAETPADTQTTAAETAAVTSIDSLDPKLPTYDMNGETFTILTNNWGLHDGAFTMVGNITVDDLNGVTTNDAVYNRNLAVTDKYDCVIAEVNNDDKAKTDNMLKKSVAAGDGAYDVYFLRLQQFMPDASAGYIVDLSEVPVVNWSNPWWEANSYDALSVYKHHFVVASYLTYVDKDATSALLFNKNLAENYSLPDLYETVSSGAWTLDALGKYVVMVSSDLNGDGVMDENDQYGLYDERDTLCAFLNGCGCYVAEKDADGVPVLTFLNEKNVSVMDKTADIMYDKQHAFNTMYWEGHGGEDFNVVKERNFAADMALFMWVRLDNIHQLRNMDTDFGILPDPKWDEAQESYLSLVNPWTSVAMSIPVPVDTAKLKDLGAFLEDWGYQAMKYQKDAYYEVTLKGKITRDTASQAMLDLIFADRTYDIGAVGTFGDIASFVYLVMTDDRDWSSCFAKYQSKAQKVIDKYTAAFAANG